MLSEQDRKAALEALSEYINRWDHNTIDKTAFDLERDALLHGYELGMQAAYEKAALKIEDEKWPWNDGPGLVAKECAKIVRTLAKGDKP